MADEEVITTGVVITATATATHPEGAELPEESK